MLNGIAGELRSLIGEVAGEARKVTGGWSEPETRTIVIAKPYCSPARHIVTGTLEQYGVKIYEFAESVKMVNPLTVMKLTSRIPSDSGLRIPSALPVAQIAKVTVSEKAAAWAEYLLLRTQQLYVISPYVNQRNQEWARQHGGQMPPAWADGKPWIERSCTEGINAWQQVKQTEKRLNSRKERGR